VKRGEIYLVDFGKKYNSEFGKRRPAVIVQNDIANRNIGKVAFKGITVAPLTTNLQGGTVRLRIEAREGLERTSEICINEVCTLDIRRFDLSKPLTVLDARETALLDARMRAHLAL